MHKILILLLVLGVILTPINAQGNPVLSARAAVLIDYETGKILYDKNCEEKLPMASTTKIITAITAIEHGNPDDIVTVSHNAAATEGSSVWLSPGEELTLDNLLYALMLESGNDASVAIAEHIGGSVEKFAVMMNDTCKKAGAVSTNCVTPSGLDDEFHYTTARDLAYITRYAMQSETFRKIVSTYKTTIPWQDKEWDRSLVNHNKMLNLYSGADGVKTGYTKKSGRCLVSSAVRDGWRVIAVTLDAADDWNDHTKMLDYAFDTFRETDTVLIADYPLGNIKTPGFSQECIPFGSEETIVLRRFTDSHNVEITHNLPESMPAPVEKGEKLGTADIHLDGEYYKTINLIALESAPKNSKAFILIEKYRIYLKSLLYLLR